MLHTPASLCRCALLCASALAAGLCAPLAAQAGSHFAPAGAPSVVNQTLAFNQKQAKIAIRGDGQRFAVTWASNVPYHDVFVRLFDGQGTPLSPEIQCNAPIPGKRQDEPTVAMDEHGHVLVAWSDRDGLDGDGMGVFARAFDVNGAAFGPNFIASNTTAQSQWEPFAAPRPGGGFVLGWTGNDDGKCFLRLFDCDGTPLGNEFKANVLDNNAQTDPEPAVTRDGSTFVAWIDFGGYGGAGTGTNIFARLFDAQGVPKEPVEFLVNTNTLPGEQREPKTAADGLGHFVAVWEDRQQDASGIDILARRYDETGTPLGPEFQANTTEAGDQTFPAVACDWVGNFTICWQDGSEVRAQRYDASGAELGDEFLVHTPAAGIGGYPDVDMEWSGQLFAFVYDSPDADDPFKSDVGLALWKHAPLTQVGAATPGGSFGLDLDLPGGAGLYRFVLLALGTLPGMPLPDGRTLELSLDPVFLFSLTTPDGGGAFSGFTGTLGASATASASIQLPPNGALVGLVLEASVVTLDLGDGPGLAAQLRHVVHPLAITVQ
ncbi:MAG TPA: hypothetical protein VFY71_02675 [Planctomycetota bacterium]|nr:hypothetical protein [Planctomycetota bacterium]